MNEPQASGTSGIGRDETRCPVLSGEPRACLSVGSEGPFEPLDRRVVFDLKKESDATETAGARAQTHTHAHTC